MTGAKPSGALPRGFRLAHRPALDGLRGVAVGAVLLGHARLPFLPGGWVGVDLFFVLSGFLITALLLEERERTGRIDLARFYGRRALRLLPALVAVVGTSLLYGGLAPAAIARELPGDALACLVHVENWRRALGAHTGPVLGHAWSLSIEEQFYLSWPLLLWALPRRRLLLGCALGGALGCALLRAALYRDVSWVPRLYHGTDTRADGLLLGCALGLVVGLPGVAARLEQARRLVGALAIMGILLLSLSALALRADAALLYRGGLLLVAVAAAALLLGALVAPPGLLCAAPLTWLGRISYGLYLWHYPVFQIFWIHGWLSPAGRILAAALSVVAAAVSYAVLERPFLDLKERLRPL